MIIAFKTISIEILIEILGMVWTFLAEELDAFVEIYHSGNINCIDFQVIVVSSEWQHWGTLQVGEHVPNSVVTPAVRKLFLEPLHI